MPSSEDWLEDPLMEIEGGSYKYRNLKRPIDDKQNELWWGFHFATRLKLDGADHFCRLALGAASMPDDLGLPLLAHRQIEWYLEAFFFELMSAYNTLLQELNIVYAYDPEFKPRDVNWNNIKDKLPQKVADYMDEEWEKEWFDKVRRYRNPATHHYTVPLGSMKTGFGDKPLDYSEHTVYIHYLDKDGNFKSEEIKFCRDYLRNMVKYISSVWGKMLAEFQ